MSWTDHLLPSSVLLIPTGSRVLCEKIVKENVNESSPWSGGNIKMCQSRLNEKGQSCKLKAGLVPCSFKEAHWTRKMFGVYLLRFVNFVKYSTLTYVVMKTMFQTNFKKPPICLNVECDCFFPKIFNPHCVPKSHSAIPADYANMFNVFCTNVWAKNKSCCGC